MNKSLIVLLSSLVGLSAQASPILWPQAEGYYAGKEVVNNSRSAHAPVAMAYPATAYYPASPAMNPYTMPSPAMNMPNPWSPMYAMPYGQPSYAAPYMQAPMYGYPNAPWAGMPSFPNMNNMSMPSMPSFDMPSFDMPSFSMPDMGDMPMMNSWPGMGNAWNPLPWGNGWNMMPFQ